jgi:hypothetical protein
MSLIASLPADQQAVLGLLVKQAKTYDDLAALLRIDRAVVEDRAHAALGALGPQDVVDLTAEQRDEIADYLLGQQSQSQQAATRQLLEGSAPGRAWARGVAGELRSLGGPGLPEIPAGRPVAPEVLDAFSGRRPSRPPQKRSSKLGGLALLGVIIVVIVLVAVLSSGGNDDKGSKTAATTPTTDTTTTPAGQPKVEAQINLRAVASGSKALGVVNIVSQGNQRALAIVAQGLAPSPRYAVWLYTSASNAKLLGFAPEVKSNGRLQGLTPVPTDVAKYREIVVTRETVDKPQRPGTIVLRGALTG